MLQAVFEPAIPASELPQTQALDSAATGTGIYTVALMINEFYIFFIPRHIRDVRTPYRNRNKGSKTLETASKAMCYCAQVRVDLLTFPLDSGCDSLTNQQYSLSQIPRLLLAIANCMKGGECGFESQGGECTYGHAVRVFLRR